MPTVSIIRVTQPNGRLVIRFSDKTEMEFASLVDLRQRINAKYNNRDFMRELMLALILANDTNLTGSVIGKTITIDLQSLTPVVMS